MYVIVLAGGGGTRLWPHSRSNNPKHLLRLVKSDTTMIQETVRRVLPLTSPDKILVVTNHKHADEVRKQLPEIPHDNVLEEPVGRNSGPAVGYGALHVAHVDPEAVILTCPADHVILKEEEFRSAVKAAAQVALDNYLVTMGISPGYPDTGYGYMELGEEIKHVDGYKVHRVLRFTEKPDLQTATEYVNSGRFVWNSGMFIWKASVILEEISKYMPNLHTALQKIKDVVGTPEERHVVNDLWPQLEDLSIDYGVLEKSDRVVTIPVDIGWSDVGDWGALAEILEKDENGNSLIGDVMTFDTRNSLIYSSGCLVTTIGLEDMIVVSTGDAMLVCPKSRAEEVRKIVNKLREMGRDTHL